MSATAWLSERKECHELHLARIIWLALVLASVLVLTLGVFSRNPRNHYWWGRKFSMSLQTLAPGGPFAGEGWWIRDGWDGPTGEFTRGQMYGLRLGRRLLRLDIVYDPVAAIKQELPNTVPGLLQALSSKDHLVKQCAGEALSKMGTSAQSTLPILLNRYQGVDEAVEWVILELAKAAGASAVTPLSEALADLDPRVRQKAAEALGEIGGDAEACVLNLAQVLHDPEPTVIMASALALRKIDGHPHGEVEALIGLLPNKDPQLRGRAIFALGEFGGDAAEAVPPLIETLRGGSPEAAGLVARTLGLIGPAARPAIPLLIEKLDSDNQQTLMFSMEALGRFGEDADAAIPKLLALAETPEAMWGAIHALSTMGTSAVPSLVELYRSGRHGQHSWAARAFMKQGPKAAAAVPALVEDLQSESAGSVSLAALVLGCIGEDAKVAVPRLAELIHDDDAQVRIRAAEALWRLDRRSDEVLPVMVAELENWSRDPNALLGLTQDAHGQSRQQVAAAVLGEIGPAATHAVPLLQMMLRSSFASQRESAAKALERIAQQSH